MKDSVEHVITLDDSIAETVRQAKQKLRINARTQELLRVNGAAYDYSPEKARKQAISEVLGWPANSEDIDIPLVQSN